MTTGLRHALEDYLRIRRALGFQLDEPARLLPQFLAGLERDGADRISVDAALRFATEPAGAHPVNWWLRLNAVRGFAKYLHALDPTIEVPPPRLLPRPRCRAVPYLYTDREVFAVLAAAGRLQPPPRAATYQTAIGLLAASGMRVSEVVHLRSDDLDAPHRLLTILHSKRGSSRIIPLHPTTVAALAAYARQRDRLRPISGTFFVSTTRLALRPGDVSDVFRTLVRTVGLVARSPGCRPRLHDLRHSFAVHTLLDWYAAGLDVQARLPLLSAYLGHVSPADTYWYLSAAPELMALAAARRQNWQERS